MRIFVGNLALEVDEDELKTLFAQQGKVLSVKIFRDMLTRISKGFGIIEMLVKDEAQKAIDLLNTFELKGKQLVVNEARPQKPRGSNGKIY